MMGPIAAIGSVLSKFATFSGRATRAEFWWWAMFQSFGMLAVIILDIAMLDPAIAIADLNFFSFFTPFFALFTIIPTLAVTVRRLHDIGRSGAWYLLNFVPFGSIILIIFYVLPSETDENIHGQSPFGPRVPPGGYDISDPYAPRTKKAAKGNAFASYAILAEGRAEPSAEQREAQREQIRDYYRSRVLGNQGDPA